MKQLYVIGMGPGGADQLTPQARYALEASQVLCGYTTYLDLARDFQDGREIVSTPMTQELERCRLALERAAEGKTTAMICSGDAGVYGMAGPILQMAEDFPEVEIEVIPGVTAALAGAAVLGAPLMHDFAVISLSDLLTPWPVIEKRLDCAGAGDFVLCLYNPMSKKRRDHLRRACDILLKRRSGDTVCGWVKNIGREGQEHRLLTLEELREEARETAKTLEAIDQQIFLCEEFARYKVQFIEEGVNQKFRLARFRLFQEQVNGGLADCCEPTYEGVPYGSLNNGMRINLGVDVIRTISEHYGLKVPLVVDNAESVTRLAGIDTQVIRLVVSEADQALRVEVSE